MKIDELKDKVSIEEILIHYGWDQYWFGTRKGWSEWSSTRCPFHLDEQPSASVNYLRNRFHCFVCDVSGDILDIVMKMEHLPLHEAKRWIEDNFLS